MWELNDATVRSAQSQQERAWELCLIVTTGAGCLVCGFLFCLFAHFILLWHLDMEDENQKIVSCHEYTLITDASWSHWSQTPFLYTFPPPYVDQPCRTVGRFFPLAHQYFAECALVPKSWLSTQASDFLLPFCHYAMVFLGQWYTP